MQSTAISRPRCLDFLTEVYGNKKGPSGPFLFQLLQGRNQGFEFRFNEGPLLGKVVTRKCHHLSFKGHGAPLFHGGPQCMSDFRNGVDVLSCCGLLDSVKSLLECAEVDLDELHPLGGVVCEDDFEIIR